MRRLRPSNKHLDHVGNLNRICLIRIILGCLPCICLIRIYALELAFCLFGKRNLLKLTLIIGLFRQHL